MNTENSTTVTEFNNAWKGRGTLGNLVTELKRQKYSRHDFVADVRDVSFSAGKGSLFVNPLSAAASEWLPNGATRFNKSAARQVAERTNPNIPAKFFEAMIALARNSQTQEVLAPTAAVQNVLEAAEMSGEHQEALLEYFLRDYDKTQFGLAQAVSRLAQDVDADDAITLENMAGKIIEDKTFAVVGA